MDALKQSQTAHPLPFLLTSSTDHVTPVTGVTPTVTLSKDGAAFAAPAGVVTEIANGWYKVAANATDANTLGTLIVHATATGSDPVDATWRIVAYDPDDAAALGLSRLDAAVSSVAAAVWTVLTSGLTTVGSIGKLLATFVFTGANVNANAQVIADKTGYTVSTVSDKTGYALTAGEHTTISGTDVPSGLTTQGYTTARAGYLDTLNGLVAAIWAAATSGLVTVGSIGKLLATFTFTSANVNANAQVVADKTGYTASTVSDKTGYALTAGEHTLVSGTDVPAALTAQGYTTARAGYMDVLNGLVAAVWAAATRTLSAFGFGVTVTTNLDKDGYTASTVSDKTGYSLAVAPPTAAQVIAAFRGQGIALNPAANSYDEVMSLVRALCLGKRVNTSPTTEDVYAHDGLARLATITYQTGGIALTAAATGSTAARD